MGISRSKRFGRINRQGAFVDGKCRGPLGLGMSLPVSSHKLRPTVDSLAPSLFPGLPAAFSLSLFVPSNDPCQGARDHCFTYGEIPWLSPFPSSVTTSPEGEKDREREREDAFCWCTSALRVSIRASGASVDLSAGGVLLGQGGPTADDYSERRCAQTRYSERRATRYSGARLS